MPILAKIYLPIALTLQALVFGGDVIDAISGCLDGDIPAKAVNVWTTFATAMAPYLVVATETLSQAFAAIS